MQVENQIAAVAKWDTRQRYKGIGRLGYAVNHRIDVGETAEAIAEFFATHPDGLEATGGQMPYPLVITRSGVIQQALELGDWSPHAMRFSFSGLGIGWIGDFRKHPPTEAQLSTGLWITTLLMGWGLRIVGHTELKGAARDPDKQCPGDLLDLAWLRREARRARTRGAPQALEAERVLLKAGIVF